MIIIKKYSNRKLYSSNKNQNFKKGYVTMEDLKELVKNGSEFKVFDDKTGQEVTNQTLIGILGTMGDQLDSKNLLGIIRGN